MSRLSPAAPRHDPYWDMDGRGARRSRSQRRFVRWAVAAVAVLFLALVISRLPAIDPSLLTTEAGRPFLAGAIFSLLGASTLIALAKIRAVSKH